MYMFNVLCPGLEWVDDTEPLILFLWVMSVFMYQLNIVDRFFNNDFFWTGLRRGKNLQEESDTHQCFIHSELL